MEGVINTFVFKVLSYFTILPNSTASDYGYKFQGLVK